jgi:ABC-type branched-subunit amino acid transport system substrate-binding protein
MKRLLFYLLAAVVVVTTAASADEFKIGIIVPSFGDPRSREIIAGVEQAVTDINDSGGINGERVSLESSADGFSAESHLGIMERYSAQSIRFVIADIRSTDFYSRVSTPYAKRAMLLFLTVPGAEPGLTDRSLWNTFRIGRGDDREYALTTKPRDPRKGDGSQKSKPDASVADVYDAYGYAALQVIADGVKQARSTEVRSVATVLHEGNSVDTVLGSIVFDGKGDIANR